MHKNKKYALTITDLGKKGEGVGKHDGFTLFVKGALPGDEIETLVLKTKKTYGYGKLVNILKPSPMRIKPPCPLTERCGGCQIQHMNYAEQLSLKTRHVKDAIERVGKLKDIEIKPCIGMEDPFFYRNKMQFAIGQKDPRINIGLFSIASHHIVDIDKCYIQHPNTDKVILIVRDFLYEKNISIYDESKHQGLVRHLVIRYSFARDEMMVMLVINGEKLPEQNELVKRLRELPYVKSIGINHNVHQGDTVLRGKVTILWGEKFIVEEIDGIEFEISPMSFFQVNPIQTKTLFDTILKKAALKKEDIVWDLYCGVGSISLLLAKKAKHVFGIDNVPEAIQDAKRNAERNKLTNLDFISGDVEKNIGHLEHPNVVVLDPPRKGCEEVVLESVAYAKPDRIVYVSCDPVTLARDLARLEALGYKTREIQPIDMFPHTMHVESVSVLSKD